MCASSSISYRSILSLIEISSPLLIYLSTNLGLFQMIDITLLRARDTRVTVEGLGWAFVICHSKSRGCISFLDIFSIKLSMPESVARINCHLFRHVIVTVLLYFCKMSIASAESGDPEPLLLSLYVQQIWQTYIKSVVYGIEYVKLPYANPAIEDKVIH